MTKFMNGSPVTSKISPDNPRRLLHQHGGSMGAEQKPEWLTLGTINTELSNSAYGMGPFLVHSDGRLALRNPDQPPGFRFMVQSCAVKVGLREDRMLLRAVLGRVPSSISSSKPVREAIFNMLRSMVASLPKDWKMHLLPDHCVALDTEDMIGTPPTATELLTQLTCYTLTLQPYLELAAESGLEPVGASPPDRGGKAST